MTQKKLNREMLAFLKSEGLLLGTSLARNIEKKVRQGQKLTDVEQGILHHGITNEKLRFVNKTYLNCATTDDIPYAFGLNLK
jgi:hypothetical protein